MFQRNDKALITARIITLVVVIIFAVGSFAMGIALAIAIHGALFLTAFVGWFLCWLAWVFARLHLSYLCDIKLIRNKLYDESNAGLEVFLSSDRSGTNEEVRAVNRELSEIYSLLSSGEITNEEYEKRKKELEKRKNELTKEER